MPLTDMTVSALSACHLEEANGLRFVPGLHSYDQLTDKCRLLETAARAKVLLPRSLVADSLELALIHSSRLGYPAILKPARSRVRVHDKILSTVVSRAIDAEDVQRRLAAAPWFPDCPVIVQEFVPGHGAGVFCLYDRDHAVAWFAHRRIREKPPSGGVSVLCESVVPDPRLVAYADAILRAAAYRGVAMVEFRIAPDGRPYLMEVNARFWGSLQLAIDCGVDFPWLYYQLQTGQTVRPIEQYEIGRRLRWLLGDLDALLLQLRSPSLAHSEKWRAVAQFLATGFDVRCHQEVFRWSDPLPAWQELRQWVAAVL